MVFPWVQGKMVHNKPLTMENAHVCIDNVICGDVPLPLPWTRFTMVGDAAGSFAQWPKSLILLEENEVNSKTRNLKRKDRFKNTEESANKVRKQSLEKASVEGNNKASCDEEQDDVRPLSVEEVGKLGFLGRSLEEKLCSLSKNATIEMVIDESVYNYKEGSVRSFLTIVEIRQMLRNQRLNVVMLQIWGSFLHQCATQSEAANVVGYMCPVKLSEYMQNGRQCEDYIAHVWKIQEEKNYILGAFYERPKNKKEIGHKRKTRKRLVFTLRSRRKA
ncbi:uncharacterized protein LOC141623516 [Silene latifolia]|uniref:uncharacterized protein LOC141623516 n=1 Tax=Silene latifolia TaxID=37657 RepID=UPI003D76CB8D